jgi:hypothetical protein
MDKYKQAEAQHWIVLRLVRRLLKSQGGHAMDSGRSVIWLIREVGIKQVMSMIKQLEEEEA